MVILLDNAVELLEGANLKRGSWGGTEAVCMMSALVPGARSTEDCETAGWPAWLAELCVSLYDADVGADDEQIAADRWAYQVAEAIALPLDYKRARHLFFIAVLQRVEHLDTADVVRPVIALHERAMTPDEPDDSEWDAARDDARDDARDAARAAAWAAARDAARAAAWAAAWAAARTAAWAAARDDAWAAARNDLINALQGATTVQPK